MQSKGINESLLNKIIIGMQRLNEKISNDVRILAKAIELDIVIFVIHQSKDNSGSMV